MTADLDTPSGELYAPLDEVLPEAGGARNLESVGAGGRNGSDAFARSRERFEGIVGWLGSEQPDGLEHSELEDRLQAEGRELLRALYQDRMDLRARREARLEGVVDATGVERRAVEADHERPLQTVFGEVRVKRLAYRARGEHNLYPADGLLNLPDEQASHGVGRLAAIESARGSFQEATSQLRERTGLTLGKRQVEQLAVRAAVDFDSFYASRARLTDEHEHDDADESVLVLSADGKGIVMRADALRPATAKAAQRASPKLKTRLSRGEKANRKRIAEVGAVYEIAPTPRTPDDLLASTAQKTLPAPKATHKWLSASVVEDAAAVVADMFDEAERRDPSHQRTWVALVDGNNHQIDRITKEAKKRDVKVTILVDVIHVLGVHLGRGVVFLQRGRPRRRSLGTREGPRGAARQGRHRGRRESAAKPPAKDSIPRRARRPTAPPITCSTSAPTSTTPPP